MNRELELAQELISFINQSPTAYQATENISLRLDKLGYKRLYENQEWKIEARGKYYVKKNDSAIIAFKIGTQEITDSGFRIIGAHTDSPTFKIKPNSEMISEGSYLKLNTEVYGGPILNTWFDRPLAIAGRVVLKGNSPLRPQSKLIDINKPLVIIPNLAIHMNRNVNEGYAINKQKDTLPLVDIINDTLEKDNYLLKLIAEDADINVEDILDFDLFLYEYDKGRLMGPNDNFISAGRLDDLWMVFDGLKALEDSNNDATTKVLIAIDNEEIGSLTMQGARSSFIKTILERIAIALGKNTEQFYNILANSIMISADLAHAVHPNSGEKHDPTNRPILTKGPVLKLAASGSYSSDGYSSAIFKSVCKEAKVPYQVFVNRSDLRGGTTIGPMMAAELAIPVIDMGAPLVAMHSVRELATTIDNYYTITAFTKFYEL
ncbi:M18 family aminopeptidase [Clostridium sp. MSJ-8]|uniref:M18 family aminopeptidase n=1 Tax=Clostridium sp. MSJ-8 TaxID=2841510 RepID=UPI001C0F177B|nr:M18 family aminopeptidase [Clostridium sp. MSJ-8]MBU5488250.1 M18 family aminopeptidase [Clostridium sp. MSJ-8]